MVGEYVLSSAHNSGLTPEFITSFCPSYFTAQEASVAPRVSATRQVIQTDGLAFGSSPITRARGARAVVPQSFHPLNTPSQLDQREKVQEHYTLVRHYLGEPFLLDVARCGSYAHRLHNWWTNLAPLSVLQLALRYTIRDPNMQVSHILDDQSSYQLVTKQDKPPWFPINTIGKPRGAWPTFVSFPITHAFQGDGPGLVYCHASVAWDEPSTEEGERALGFQTSTISHTKVTRLERNALLGRGVDLNSLTWLLVTYVLFQMYTTPTLI
jgi:hypothetical protein